MSLQYYEDNRLKRESNSDVSLSLCPNEQGALPRNSGQQKSKQGRSGVRPC